MAGDPSGSSLLEELDSSIVLPLANATRIKDDLLTQGSGEWADVKALATTWAEYLGESPRFQQLCYEFHQHGGTAIFPPANQQQQSMASSSAAAASSSTRRNTTTSTDVEIDEDFRVLLQPGDFCLPVCEDGTAESQVINLLIQLLQRRQTSKLRKAGAAQASQNESPPYAQEDEECEQETFPSTAPGSDAAVADLNQGEQRATENGNPDTTASTDMECGDTNRSDMTTIRINLPHGSISGFDPYRAYSNLDTVNCKRFTHVTMEESDQETAFHRAFKSTFGRGKAPRYGERFANDNGLQLNLCALTAAAVSKLEQDRTAMRSFMSSTIYNLRYLRRRVGSVPVWVLDKTVADRGNSSQCTSSQGMSSAASPSAECAEEEPTLNFGDEAGLDESKYASPLPDAKLPRRVGEPSSCMTSSYRSRGGGTRRVRIRTDASSETKEVSGDPMGPASKSKQPRTENVDSTQTRSRVSHMDKADALAETIKDVDTPEIDNKEKKEKDGKDDALLPGRIIFICTPSSMSTVLSRILEVNCCNLLQEASEVSMSNWDYGTSTCVSSNEPEQITDLFQDVYIVCFPHKFIRRGDPRYEGPVPSTSDIDHPVTNEEVYSEEYLNCFKRCAEILRGWPIVATTPGEDEEVVSENQLSQFSDHNVHPETVYKDSWHSMSHVEQSQENTDIETNENEESYGEEALAEEVGSEVEEDVKDSDMLDEAPEPADVPSGLSQNRIRSTTSNSRSQSRAPIRNQSQGTPVMLSPSSGPSARESSGVPEENITTGQVPDEEDP